MPDKKDVVWNILFLEDDILQSKYILTLQFSL